MRVPRMPHGEKGVILLTVIMMTIMLSLVIIGFMSASVSQVKSSQSVIDQMKAQHLAIGQFYRYNQRLIEGNYVVPSPGEVSLDGKKFSITYANVTGGTNPCNTERLRVTINY